MVPHIREIEAGLKLLLRLLKIEASSFRIRTGG